MLLTKILFPVFAHLAVLTNAGLFNPVNRESPECATVNSGQHLCCAMTIDGDQPAVIALALLAGYNLNRNSINGIACEWGPGPLGRTFLELWRRRRLIGFFSRNI
jgi:hypothetical protein